MDSLARWKASLTERERKLHELAAVALKKTLVTGEKDKDNGSYFPDKCHAYVKWLAKQPA